MEGSGPQKVIFAGRKSFLPSSFRAGALWRFFSLAENGFYHLLPELVPYGGVRAPKSDFRLPKIVVYNLPPEPGVILGLKGSRIIGLQGRML